MKDDKVGNRLSKLVERTKPEAEARSRQPVSAHRFGRSNSSRPRISNPSLTEQEKLWIEILTRR